MQVQLAKLNTMYQQFLEKLLFAGSILVADSHKIDAIFM